MTDDNFSQYINNFTTNTFSSLDDLSPQDSAAFNYICDLSPARSLVPADTRQGLPGSYPKNVDSFQQGPQVCQPSNAQLYLNDDRSENIIHNPSALEKIMADLRSEAFPDTKTQWETVPRNCEGQYQEERGVSQLVQSLHMAEYCEGGREQLEGGPQKCVMGGSLLSRGVHLNNVQTYPSGSNHLNILNSSAALFNTVNLDSRDSSLSISRKIKLTSMHQSMKSVLPLKASGIGLHLNSVVSSFRGNCIEGASLNELEARKEGPKSASIINRHLPEKMKISPISSNVADHALSNNEVSWQQLNESSQLNLQSKSSTANRKRKFFSEQTDSNEQLYQSSSNTLGTFYGEGCKRCNCSKTKCLKLYCDCFAAGLYCAGSCACQGCYNKPENEGKVIEARRQIQSRDPIAFAPKVLQKAVGPTKTSMEELTPSTPSSARHKRGCNCKKSTCMKKYCECYKESVGCSEGCRCEGCKNVFGRKEDHGLFEELARRRVSHGKEALSSKPTPYQPSPGSDLTVLSSSGKTPTSPSHSSSNKHKEILDIDVNDKDLLNYAFEERADHSSPCYDPITVCESTIKEDPPSQSYDQTLALYDANYLADVPSSAAAGVSKTKDCISSRSIRWRSSVITQIVPIDERINLQGFNSHKVFDKLEDVTSVVLKESMPVKTANVHSPRSKRVRLQELCSNSPVDFKSGRKYILQAVGSSTPLIPCTYQYKTDTQADGTNKVPANTS